MNSVPEFDEAVESATAAASAGRRQLGRNYAVEFAQNPDTFDPRKLMVLGREGLSSFVAAVGVPTAHHMPASPSPSATAASDGGDRGWSSRRMVPVPFEISALLFGTLTGVGVVFGSALVLTL